MNKIFNSSKGFTLIELLIVIAILGILATAVLSAINPVEQINRGRDTGTQSDAEQLLSAIQRFNAAQGFFPWQAGASDTLLSTGWTKVQNNAVAPDGWTVDDSGTAAHDPAVGWVAGNNVLDRLGSNTTAITDASNELLNAFTTRITGENYRGLYVYNSGDSGSSTYVCFLPQSNQFQTAALTRCTGASLPTDYPAEACSGGTAITVYSCLP